VQASREAFVPAAQMAALTRQLQDGDFVNLISTRDREFWASHVGLVVTAAAGQRNFLNSTEPQVRDESFDAFVARTQARAARAARNAAAGKPGQKLAGFKLLRLNDNIVVPPALPQPCPGSTG
jgi:hypothetical protein